MSHQSLAIKGLKFITWPLTLNSRQSKHAHLYFLAILVDRIVLHLLSFLLIHLVLGIHDLPSVHLFQVILRYLFHLRNQNSIINWRTYINLIYYKFSLHGAYSINSIHLVLNWENSGCNFFSIKNMIIFSFF